MYTLKIQKLRNQIERIDNTLEKVNLLTQAIRIADENEDIEWGYELRLELINQEIDLAFSTESLPAFAWILQAYDENPDLFSEEDFLWQYKWMMSELYDNPEVSREQIDAALSDFEMRLLRNGYGRRAIHNEELSDALVQRDLDAVELALQKVKASQRDDMSDCEACEMDAEVSAALLKSGYAAATEKALPLLEKQFTCAHVPLRTTVNLAYEGRRNGDMEKALQMAQQAEQEIYKKEKDSSILLSAIKLATYFSYTDLPKAKEWIERYLPWADGPDNRQMFQLACYMEEALGQFDPEELFNLELSESHNLFQGRPQYQANEISAHYRRLAKDLALRFDQRNGNSNFQKQLDMA
ncbi:hypothetical protein K7A41_05890 [Sphingobacterium sp. InxBP1]|uniref:hypothetical protein n=1 Tax=Sphingobacterium sp. InxBP1 TaxID=2870328 RepID=UPI0022435126|nr:hypothetical protein [Sphingobacterium sp. InxBP1]MCW8310745.1 hypothetical protein [Sphingobacterium sp. InxBP1]